jgi:hypothetical protein
MPIAVAAHPHGIGAETGGCTALTVRAVVVTVMLKVAGAEELTVTLAGVVQVAPTGAPVQLSLAVPPIPEPMMESV